VTTSRHLSVIIGTKFPAGHTKHGHRTRSSGSKRRSACPGGIPRLLAIRLNRFTRVSPRQRLSPNGLPRPACVRMFDRLAVSQRDSNPRRRENAHSHAELGAGPRALINRELGAPWPAAASPDHRQLDSFRSVRPYRRRRARPCPCRLTRPCRVGAGYRGRDVERQTTGSSAGQPGLR
jgi:hypothetical protein